MHVYRRRKRSYPASGRAGSQAQTSNPEMAPEDPTGHNLGA